MRGWVRTSNIKEAGTIGKHFFLVFVVLLKFDLLKATMYFEKGRVSMTVSLSGSTVKKAHSTYLQAQLKSVPWPVK